MSTDSLDTTRAGLVVTRRVRDKFADGGGRCGAGGGFVGWRRIPAGQDAGLEAVLRDAQGNEVRVGIEPQRESVTKVNEYATAHGLVWDGTVEDQAGGAHYVDQATVRGKYPVDCPAGVRKRIGKLAAESAEARDMHELRLEMALAARKAGYHITDEELRRVRDLSCSYVETHAVRDGIGVRTLSSLDHSAIVRLLAKLNRGVYTSLWGTSEMDDHEELVRRITQAMRSGVPFIGYFDHGGRLREIDGIVPGEAGYGGFRCHVAELAWVRRAQYSEIGKDLKEAELARYRREHHREPQCFACKTPRTLCVCSRTADGIWYGIRDARRDRLRSSEEWWSREHSVIATEEMRTAAAAAAASVREAMLRANEEAAREVEELTGGDGFESIALLIEQAELPPTERERFVTNPDIVADIAKLFRNVTKRAAETHSDYVRMLYAEFDTNDAPLGGGGLDERYLGRDGVYALYAREEMLRAYDERGDQRARANTVQYLSVSRQAAWEQRHHKLLGERPVLIDTGFKASIPKRIAREQGLELVTSGAPAAGEVAARLMKANSLGFEFRWQAAIEEFINEIEGDAKITRSARYVGDRAPAGVVEQLVHRQLEWCIRKTARDQIRRIITAEDAGEVRLDAAGLGTDRFRPRVF